MKLETLIAACIAVAAPAIAQPPSIDKEAIVQTSLIADTTAVTPGTTFTVGVLFKIQPDWHIYGKEPGESGLPTTVKWKFPEGTNFTPSIYPKDESFGDNKESHGYATETMLMTEASVAAIPDSKSIEIVADSTWLMCNKMCIRNMKSLKLTLPVGKGLPANEQLFSKYKSEANAPMGHLK